MKLSTLALSILVTIGATSCNTSTQQSKIDGSMTDNPSKSKADSLQAQEDSLAISDDYCPPCGKG